jgi:polysaccharide deacetylase family protein (PEP-CTERM system associated)
MLNALTIDVEDWYHPELVRHHVPVGECQPQIEQSTRALLDVLQEYACKATFFVVGEVVKYHPRLVEAILEQGHELGCHGMSHKPLWQLTPDQFRSELEEFSNVLNQAAPGAQVIGFRAPTFSLDNRTRWSLPILADFGYHYDSSIFPSRTPLYGVAGCPLVPYRPSAEDVRVADEHGPVLEFPMSMWTWAGVRLPVCGGVYLRVLPLAFVRSCLRQINRQRPFAVYVHPWEMFEDTPRVGLPLLSRWATYYNIDGMRRKLENLLVSFSLAPMKVVLEEMAKSRHVSGDGEVSPSSGRGEGELSV